MNDFIKLSEKAHQDPKFIAAGVEGFAMYVKGLTYSKSELLDGFVPEGALPIVGIGVKNPKRTADLLVSLDLWQKAPGGYRVKPERWSRWQRTRAEVEEVREEWREKKRKQREGKRAPVPEVSPGDTRETTEETPQEIPSESPSNVPPPESREQRAESILPSGNRTSPPPNEPEPIPLTGGWAPLGRWLEDRRVRSSLAAIEGRRSPSIPPIRAEDVAVLADVLRTNEIGIEGFVRVLGSPQAKAWRKVSPEGVVRVFRELPTEPAIPGEIRPPSVQDQIEAIRAESEARGLRGLP